jgi:hypothetical protein
MLCVLIVIFVGLAHVMKWRDGRFAELFTVQIAHTLDMTRARHPKTASYLNAGLSQFFSDGTLPTDMFLAFFEATMTDNSCRLGSSSVTPHACDIDHTRIHMLSRYDDLLRVHPAFECKPPVIEPLDVNDSEIRVLSGIYELSKVCITVPARVREGGSAMYVETATYPGRLLALLRPMFISVPKANLVSVRYFPTAANSISQFDTNMSGLYEVQLGMVTDRTIWSTQDGDLSVDNAVKREVAGSDTAIIPGGTINDVLDQVHTIPMTVFYLNFRRHVSDFPTNTAGRVVHNVLTLYFATNDLSKRSGSLFAMPAFNVSFASASATGAATITAQTGSGKKKKKRLRRR